MYARIYESNLRRQAITPALSHATGIPVPQGCCAMGQNAARWTLPGGLFTYTLTPTDYTRYRRQRGVKLIAYLVLPSKEVPAWTRG